MEAGVIVGWFFEKLFVRHLLVNSLHRPQLVGGDWKMTTTNQSIMFATYNTWPGPTSGLKQTADDGSRRSKVDTPKLHVPSHHILPSGKLT